MTADEKAIRDMVERWMAASKAGDTQKLLAMLRDDIVFMVPGQPPFGKEAFAERSAGMSDIKIDGRAEILELRALGNWAWMRNRLNISITPKSGPAITKSGYTLTIVEKNSAGDWQISRDANLVV